MLLAFHVALLAATLVSGTRLNNPADQLFLGETKKKDTLILESNAIGTATSLLGRNGLAHGNKDNKSSTQQQHQQQHQQQQQSLRHHQQEQQLIDSIEQDLLDPTSLPTLGKIPLHASIGLIKSIKQASESSERPPSPPSLPTLSPSSSLSYSSSISPLIDASAVVTAATTPLTPYPHAGAARSDERKKERKKCECTSYQVEGDGLDPRKLSLMLADKVLRHAWKETWCHSLDPLKNTPLCVTPMTAFVCCGCTNDKKLKNFQKCLNSDNYEEESEQMQKISMMYCGYASQGCDYMKMPMVETEDSSPPSDGAVLEGGTPPAWWLKTMAGRLRDLREKTTAE